VRYPISFLTLICLVFSAQAQTYTVKTVPNTKLVNNSYVSNPDNIISAGTVTEIDSILSSLENEATAQVAVVLLRSIGEADIFDFSQDLFNHWGIGSKANDNGLLVLMVLDQRTVRFHTGDGIEGLLPDAICKQIQRERMIPYFKEGDYDAAMLAGVREVAAILNNDESRADSSDGTETGQEFHIGYLSFWIILVWMIVVLISFFVKKNKKSFADSKRESGEIPKGQFTTVQWFLWFVLLPLFLMIAFTMVDQAGLFFGGIYAYAASTLVLRKRLMDNHAERWLVKKDYQILYNYYEEKQGVFSAMRFLFPIPLAFMYSSYRKKMEFFRNHPRDCKQCGSLLVKLDEQADNKYLGKGQIREEELKSVDYDVWLCKTCAGTESLIYRNRRTKYSACPQCNFVTFHLESNRTIRSATEYSTGLREEVRTCKFCSHRKVTQHTIPKITTSSSSSGGSSSGGSWGGGSSSGGGASSSW